jgi:hypothetical protein
MTIYYVRNDGNDSNLGTSANTSGSWKTLTKALGPSGISGGDTLYIAPGVYRETLEVGFASTGSTTYVYGDPKALIFAGVTPGSVRITANTQYDSLSSNFSPSTNTLINIAGKNNIVLEFLYLEYFRTGLGLSSCNNIQLRNSVLSNHNTHSGNAIKINQNITSTPHRFENLICMGGTFVNFDPLTSGIGLSGFMSAINCLAIGHKYYNNDVVHTLTSPIRFTNCTFISVASYALTTYGIGNSSHIFTNTLICSQEFSTVTWNGGVVNSVICNNCRFSGGSQHGGGGNRVLNNCSFGLPGLDFGELLLFGLAHTQFLSSKNNGYLAGAGTSAGTGTSDLFSYGWQGVAPDIGAYQYRNLNTISSYIPADKQFESITIAPDSTSQSIYIMLGATGISYNTPSFVAHYTRENSTPVAITLASQTSTGNWTSGGFAEVSPSNAPGLYRLDVPNAAFVSGATKVMVSVRGGGLNGAFHNISLNYTRLPDVETRTFISGTTSLVEYINITQSNSGSPLTGLTYQSSGLTAYYIRSGGTPTSITLNSQTVSGAYASGGFVAVDNTNMPGLYRIDIPNAALASGVASATVYLRGAGNMNPIRIEYK